jgi:predicted MFS family arabinose efflux permease
MGAVMSAFAVASVLGVPAGLELARLWGWRAPFFAVAALGAALVTIAIFVMPKMRGHVERVLRERHEPRPPLFDSLTLLSLGNTAIVALGVFAIVPNISAFLQHNLGYPRERLGLLYLVGGVASFAATRVVGPLVDRFGATRLLSAGTAVFMTATFFGFVHPLHQVPVLAVFVLFMLSATLRGVPLQALASRVPRPQQRARFMSAQSATQHLASAVGAIVASALLSADASGRLLGMEHVALGSLVLAMAVPFVSFLVETRVRARERPAGTASPA